MSLMQLFHLSLFPMFHLCVCVSESGLLYSLMAALAYFDFSCALVCVCMCVFVGVCVVQENMQTS